MSETDTIEALSEEVQQTVDLTREIYYMIQEKSGRIIEPIFEAAGESQQLDLQARSLP